MVSNTVCQWFYFLVLVHNIERNFMFLWHLGFEPMTMPCSFHLSKDPVKTAILWYSCIVFYWPCAYQNWVMWLIFEANFSCFLFRYSMAAIVLPLKKKETGKVCIKNQSHYSVLLSQGLLNRWTSQLDLGCTTEGLERVVSVHNST